MQQYFNNRFLKYQLIIDEKETQTEPAEPTTQYQAAIPDTASNTVEKELKDRLKLDLDFWSVLFAGFHPLPLPVNAELYLRAQPVQ